MMHFTDGTKRIPTKLPKHGHGTVAAVTDLNNKYFMLEISMFIWENIVF